MGVLLKMVLKMVNAMSNSVVPKFTIIIGNSYGEKESILMWKGYDPRLIVSWPTVSISSYGW